MRRNKSSAVSTGASNKDINLTISTNIADLTTIIADTSSSNLVNEQENKIRNLLKELQNLVKSCEVSLNISTNHEFKS